MKLSGNQKVGALVAAVLPLVASIYGQQAAQREQNQARATEHQARMEAQRHVVDAADSAAAQQLNQAFKDLGKSSSDGKLQTVELCATLHTSLDLLRQTAPTPRTEAVVAAWLTYRVEGEGNLLVCNCRRTIAVARAAWLKQMKEQEWASALAPDGKPLHQDLIFALNAADIECNLTQAKAPTTALSPTPTAAALSVATTRTHRGSRTPVAEQTATPSVAPPSASPTFAVPWTTPLAHPSPGARVYFQVPDDPAKDRLSVLRVALDRAGYRVHEVEVVGDKRAPACAELRYVYAVDTPEADALLKGLNQPGVLKQLLGEPTDKNKVREFRLRRMSRYEGRSLNRVYEVWLPRAGGQECQ